MLKGIAQLTACSVLALAGFASTADADVVTKRVEVQVQPKVIDACLVGPERISARLKFIASVTTKDAEPPDKVRMAYQIVDKSSGWTIGSRAINLRKSSGYVGKSRRFSVDAGHRLSYRVKMSFRAFGKTWRSSKRYKDRAPSAEDLVGAPYC